MYSQILKFYRYWILLKFMFFSYVPYQPSSLHVPHILPYIYPCPYVSPESSLSNPLPYPILKVLPQVLLYSFSSSQSFYVLKSFPPSPSSLSLRLLQFSISKNTQDILVFLQLRKMLPYLLLVRSWHSTTWGHFRLPATEMNHVNNLLKKTRKTNWKQQPFLGGCGGGVVI